LIPSSLQRTMNEHDEELQSLQKQLHTLKELYRAAKKQEGPQPEDNRRLVELTIDNERYQQRIDKLTTGLDEREKKLTDLQRASSALNVKLNDSLKSLQQVQTELKEQTQLRLDAEAEVEALHLQFASLKTKHAHLLHQAQDLANEKQLWHTERNGLLNERGLHINERDIAAQNFSRMQARYDELQKLFDETESTRYALAKDKQQLLEDIEKVVHAQDEAEARLKFAHFHLAKKVKETTELSDKIQFAEQQLVDRESAINQLTSKITEMQNALEEQRLQEKRLHEQSQEVIKSAEAVAAGWEQKFALVNKKWQEAELRIQELAQISSKYQQMQSLWERLDIFFDKPGDGSKKTSLPQQITMPEVKIEVESLAEAVRDTRVPFQNLFDMPKSPPKRIKQNLFE